MPHLPALFLAVLCLASAPIARSAMPVPDPSLLTASDLFRIKEVRSPALSSDGKWVVYVVRSAEPADMPATNHVERDQLWIAAADGQTAPRPLIESKSNDFNPRWSPQGNRLAFVRDAKAGVAQIFLVELSADGKAGDPTPLTSFETGANDPQWSPDGNRILVSSPLSWEPLRQAAKTLPARGHAPATANPDGTPAEIRAWLDGNGARENPVVMNGDSDGSSDAPRCYQLVTVKDGHASPLVIEGIGKGFLSSARWRPDRSGIVAIGPRMTGEKTDRVTFNNIYSVDLVTGKSRVLIGEAGSKYSEPTPSPDGKWIAYAETAGGIFSFEQATVAIIPTEGGTPKILTSTLDRNATHLKWSADSTMIYFTAADRGCYSLYRVPVAHGGADSLTSNRTWGIQDYDVGAQGLVQVVTHPDDPFELYHASLDGKTTASLTTHNSAWLKEKKLSAYDPHRLETSEGITIDYWTLKPTGFEIGKKYPLLTLIHDGPAKMGGPGDATHWFEMQFLAAHGYALVFCNPRGSAGYGRDFTRANFRDWAIGPSKEVLYATGFVAKESYVDATRQGMVGAGYGGYLVAWLAGHDHRFKAGVAIRGMYDLPTFFGSSDRPQAISRYWDGYPWQEDIRILLDRDSPLNYADNINTPLLVIQSDADPAATATQSRLLYGNLKQLGREVDYVRYPAESRISGSSETPDQKLDQLLRTEDFLRRHLCEK
ncbi:MAG TPA: S9 family peptidase [Lacunisphaera sp.]